MQVRTNIVPVVVYFCWSSQLPKCSWCSRSVPMYCERLWRLLVRRRLVVAGGLRLWNAARRGKTFHIKYDWFV